MFLKAGVVGLTPIPVSVLHSPACQILKPVFSPLICYAQVGDVFSHVLEDAVFLTIPGSGHRGLYLGAQSLRSIKVRLSTTAHKVLLSDLSTRREEHP